MNQARFAVLVAGGSGSRMKSAVPKQFLLLNEKPVLCHTIQSFLTAYSDIQIILVLPEEHLDTGREIISKHFSGKSISIVTGGDTRFQSVKNGLQHVSENGVVFIHDAVRCLVSPALIARCHDVAVEKGSAIPVIAAKDSIRISDPNGNHAVDRDTVKLVQTPQVFQSQLILEAFRQPYQHHFTDDATVLEAMGEKVWLVEGEETNLKITHPIDLIIAAKIIEERTNV